MSQLVQDFAGEPVVVLGMNADDKKADADFVAKEMKPTYLTLLVGDDVAAGYCVDALPTLVVIDRAGVVRHSYVPYIMTFREDIGKAVRKLLAETPQ